MSSIDPGRRPAEERSTVLTNNDPRYGNPSAAGRWTATPDPAAPETCSLPDGMLGKIPKAAIIAWASGSKGPPSGRKDKKMRRRTRKIAVVLAVIFVMSTVNAPASFAETSFYKASPYVKNQQLVDAGAKSFDERLAIGKPESTPDAPVDATNLEDAILTGGLSPGKTRMPDMMLAGISGDEMALAAAADDSTPASDGAADETADEGPETNGQGDQLTKGAPADAGSDSTVGGLTKNAADENPDGYASPAPGGASEPIVDDYAQAQGELGREPDPGQNAVPQSPQNTDPAHAELAGTDTGIETPMEPKASDGGLQPEDDGEPSEKSSHTDELAVISPPQSDEDGSEDGTGKAPADGAVPTGTTPGELSTEEPPEVEDPDPEDQDAAGEPDDEAEQAFADPLSKDEDGKNPPAEVEPADHPSKDDSSSDSGSGEDDGGPEDRGSSELAAASLPGTSDDDPAPKDNSPIEEEDPSNVGLETIGTGPPSDQTPSDGSTDDERYEEEDNPDEEFADSTASIDQSSSVQVFTEDGSSAEVQASQVTAVDGDQEEDRITLSHAPGQGEDKGSKPEAHGELAGKDAEDDAGLAAAEPGENEDTSGAADPAVPERGHDGPGSETQEVPKDTSRPTAGEPEPVDENVRNPETPAPVGTEPEETDTAAEEPGRKPQSTDDEKRPDRTSQNTTPQAHDPQEEPSKVGNAGVQDSSPQEAPAQTASTRRQSNDGQSSKHQPELAQQVVRQERHAAHQVARAQRIAARQAAAQEAEVAAQGCVEPAAESVAEQSWEQPIQQADGGVPADVSYAAPAVKETYTSQDASTYGEVQEAPAVASGPTYEETTYQDFSTQVPTQELEPAPQVDSQQLEPAPQVTNTLVAPSSKTPSSGSQEAVQPATGGGEAASSVDTVLQNTTSTTTARGQN